MAWKFNPFTGSLDQTGSGGGGSGWNLTGNSGTTAGTNFVGTADDQDVVIKRNSVEVIRVYDESRVGIQTSQPLHPLHVNASVGATIDSVVTASVTTANESLATSPTGSITLIEEFAAPNIDNISQVTDTGSFTATGQTIDYQVRQVILANGTYYSSQYFQSSSFTDSINDSTTSFELTLTFSSLSSDCTHLLIEKQVNGGGFNDYTVVPVASSYTDTNFSGTEGTSGWPSQYVLSYTVPTAPSGATGQEIDIGFGNYTESGTTYDFQIRSAVQVGGIYYCEQTGTSGNFTDSNMGQQFNLQVDWTPGDGTDQVIRISTNGGSSWEYQFVGSMSGSFVWSGQGNDSAAETAWGTDTSGIQLQYAFKAFAKNTAPSGAIVYTASADTYYGTITTPNVNYIFKHSYTGMTGSGAKVIADYNQGITNGLDITTDFYDVGFSTWGSGTTVTPTTYAFSSGATRYFKFVGFSSPIYSPTPLVVSATTSASGQYFSGSFTFPSGVTTVRILVSTNGVTYTGSKTINSPTSTFTYDAVDSGWGGSTTITPTSFVPAGVRVDRAMTTSSDSPNIILVEPTGSGTRYSGIGFGYSTGATGAATILNNIVTEMTTGYMKIGASRVVGYTNTAHNSEAWSLGSNTVLNSNKSSSTHPTIYASHSSDPLAYFYSASNSTRGTLYLGSTSLTSAVTDALLCVAPQAGGGAGLVFRRTSGFSGDNIRIDEAGSYKAGWGAAGRMYLNASAISSTTYLNIGGTGSGSQIRLAAGSIGTVEGDISNSSSQKCITAFVDGVQQYDVRAPFVQTATATCANTTTETTISSTGIGTLTLPANFFVAGKTIRICARGIHSATGTPNLTMKVKFGSTVILTTGTHAMHGDTNALWEIDGIITCRTTGGSGTVFAQGKFADFGSGGHTVQMVNTATTTVNTTTTQAVTISAQWGTASASNTISCTNLTLEVLV